MTDTTTTETAPTAPAEAPAFDPERRATELAILDALRAVVDRCWAWVLTLPRPEPGATVEPIRGRAQQS